MQVQNTPKIRVIFGALMLTMLMSSLGQMIFSTALPTVVGELGGVEHMSWVISAFMVTMTIAMPINGKLGDGLGRKWLYIGSIALFVVGSILGGFADSMGLLIFGRAVQGFGAGGMMVNSQAIIAEVVSARERGKYMGIMGAVFGVSSVLGPVLGGWFTDGPGWRWGMWMNIPLGLIAIAVSTAVLATPIRSRTKLNFDWLGTMVLVLATTSIILITTWGGMDYAWSSPLIISLIFTAVGACVLFVFVERHVQNPLIPLTLFRNRNMALTTVAGMIVGFVMVGVIAYMPTYFQMVHGLTPTDAGLMMSPMALGLLGVGIFVGFLISKTGHYKYYPVVGMALTASGLFLLSRLTPSSSLLEMGLDILLFGAGLGMVVQVLMLIVQNSFPIALVGTATAANNFFRQMGSALGASVVGSLFIHNLTRNVQDRLPQAASQLNPADAGFTQNFDRAKLTPDLVSNLPDVIREAVVGSYNDALTPIFLLMAPLALIAMVLVVCIKEEPLKETVM